MTDTDNTKNNNSIESPLHEELQEDSLDIGEEDTKEQERTVEEERDEYLAGWQRAQADFQNLKKQHDAERAMFTTLGKESLLRDLIPMLDNFDAAFSNKEVWESVDKNWRIGIEYISNQFGQILEQHGVTSYGSVGEVFDNELHEAVEMVPVEDESQKSTVVAVMQKGYKMGDKNIRPAKVKVGE